MMTVNELAERVWHGKHAIRKAYGDDQMWRVFISRADFEWLRADDQSTIYGLPVLVDERLKSGNVELRVTVVA